MRRLAAHPERRHECGCSTGSMLEREGGRDLPSSDPTRPFGPACPSPVRLRAIPSTEPNVAPQRGPAQPLPTRTGITPLQLIPSPGLCILLLRAPHAPLEDRQPDCSPQTVIVLAHASSFPSLSRRCNQGGSAERDPSCTNCEFPASAQGTRGALAGQEWEGGRGRCGGKVELAAD